MNRALASVLANQRARLDAALEGLSTADFEREPGGDCNSIQRIGAHLVMLVRFQLMLLESPRADSIDTESTPADADALQRTLAHALDELAGAVAEHDPEDWERVPDVPRDGKWGDEPTLERVVRPMNDFTNHLGGIRALRRMFGNDIPRVQ